MKSQQPEVQGSANTQSGSKTTATMINSITKPKPSTSQEMEDTDSSSEDESCEKCAICLRLMKKQEVGGPDNCNHLFCTSCIMEWAKNSDVCPYDRQLYSTISVRENIGSVVSRVVEKPYSYGNLYSKCRVCRLDERLDRILMCSTCSTSVHPHCLNPPMENVHFPYDNNCPPCARWLSRCINVPLTEEVSMSVPAPDIKTETERKRKRKRRQPGLSKLKIKIEKPDVVKICTGSRNRSKSVRRSRSPIRWRSISPIRWRSISPIRWRSKSPIRRRAKSPIQKLSGNNSMLKRDSLSFSRLRFLSLKKGPSKSIRRTVLQTDSGILKINVHV